MVKFGQSVLPTSVRINFCKLYEMHYYITIKVLICNSFSTQEFTFLYISSIPCLPCQKEMRLLKISSPVLMKEGFWSRISKGKKRTIWPTHDLAKKFSRWLRRISSWDRILTLTGICQAKLHLTRFQPKECFIRELKVPWYILVSFSLTSRSIVKCGFNCKHNDRAWDAEKKPGDGTTAPPARRPCQQSLFSQGTYFTNISSGVGYLFNPSSNTIKVSAINLIQ